MFDGGKVQGQSYEYPYGELIIGFYRLPLSAQDMRLGYDLYMISQSFQVMLSVTGYLYACIWSAHSQEVSLELTLNHT